MEGVDCLAELTEGWSVLSIFNTAVSVSADVKEHHVFVLHLSETISVQTLRWSFERAGRRTISHVGDGSITKSHRRGFVCSWAFVHIQFMGHTGHILSS